MSTIANVVPAEEHELHAMLLKKYELPKGVRLVLDIHMKYSTFTAIIMASFVYGLIVLVQMVTAKGPHPNTAYWLALWGFTCSALYLSLTGVALSFLVIKMCNDVPWTALRALHSEMNRQTEQASEDDQKGVNKDSHGIPSAATDEGALAATPIVQQDRYTELESFGMSPMFKKLVRFNHWVFFAAYLCTVTACGLQALNGTLVNAVGITILYGSTTAIAVGLFIVSAGV